ncbi:MAG: hypothetical protein EXS05_22125 [Planctomycetaceae bacterium]|nr:hypothetical protein [Planctomycetaceae bacterium]
MIVNGYLHLPSTHSEKWIKLGDVLHFETPGSVGKPAGWDDDFAAVAVLSKDLTVGLNAALWVEAKLALGFPCRKEL